jgi:hypothetical protein
MRDPVTVISSSSLSGGAFCAYAADIAPTATVVALESKASLTACLKFDFVDITNPLCKKRTWLSALLYFCYAYLLYITDE